VPRRCCIITAAPKLERTGDVDGALEAVRDRSQACPEPSAPRGEGLTISGADGNPARGLAILEKAHQLNPDNPRSYILLSEDLSTYHENRRENVERSLSVMQDAVKRFQDDPEVHERLIILHMMRRDQPAAEAVLAEALKANVTAPAYWLEMARVCPAASPSHRRSGLTRDQCHLRKGSCQFRTGDLEIGTQVADHSG